MNRAISTPALLDEVVEAFEAACERGGAVGLSEFVPHEEHSDYSAIVTELVRVDMEYGWRDEKPRRLEDYIDQFPRVLVGDELSAIAFEEYRLRRQAGESVTREEYCDRLSIPANDWPELPIGEVTESSSNGEAQGLANTDAATVFPLVGEKFLDYELVGELGRGAFARVYLARQGDLSNRFVVLKVSPREDVEPQRLAQLQHTNIVPIYSLHRQDGMQAVCMPFLGPNTLADILGTFQVSLSLPLSGQALASTIAARQASTVVREATKDGGEQSDAEQEDSYELKSVANVSAI